MISICLLSLFALSDAFTLVPQPEVPNAPNYVKFGSVPDFSEGATVTSVKSGLWSDSATWSRVPALDDVVLVSAGHAVTFDASSTPALDRVAVKGTLSFKPDVLTELLVGTLFVAKGGALIIGTAAAPVTALARVLWRDDKAINSTVDPEQYQLGLVSLGQVTIHGRPIARPFLRAKKSLTANDSYSGAALGATPFELHDLPGAGWLAGDEVLIPESRQIDQDSYPKYDVVSFGFTETARIASTAGDTLTLAGAGLVNPHPGAVNMSGQYDVDANGRRMFVPHVANLERTVIFESLESRKATLERRTPNWDRLGHAIILSQGRGDIRYASFLGMGRTRSWAPTAPLVNQIGRYAVHFHHAIGPESAANDPFIHSFIGNVIRNATKWGLSIHNTHFSEFRHNIVYGAGGAGILTEDGNEYENIIADNFVLGVVGTGRPGNNNFNGIATESTGIWLHGPWSRTLRNVMNNIIAVGDDCVVRVKRTRVSGPSAFGISMFFNHVGDPNLKWIPTSKASMLGWKEVLVHLQPAIVEDNEVYSNSAGLTSWFVGVGTLIPAKANATGFGDHVNVVNGLRFWHVTYRGVYGYQSHRITWTNVMMRNRDNYGTFFGGNDYRSTDMIFHKLDVQGVGGCIDLPFVNSFQCKAPTTWTNCDSTPTTMRVVDSFCMAPVFTSLEITYGNFNSGADNSPVRVVVENSRHVIIGDPGNPQGTRLVGTSCNVNANYLQRTEFFVLDHNGTKGENFQVHFLQSRPDAPFPFADSSAGYCCGQPITANWRCTTVGAPRVNMTNGDVFRETGNAFAGSIVPDACFAEKPKRPGFLTFARPSVLPAYTGGATHNYPLHTCDIADLNRFTPPITRYSGPAQHATRGETGPLYAPGNHFNPNNGAVVVTLPTPASFTTKATVATTLPSVGTTTTTSKASGTTTTSKASGTTTTTSQQTNNMPTTTVATCVAGTRGCQPRGGVCGANACDAGLDCGQGVCLKLYNTCVTGNVGCECGANRQCAASLTCKENGNVCIAAPTSCTPGSLGCQCSKSGAACSGDSVCVDDVCVTEACPPATIGCPCYRDKLCDDGLTCNELGMFGKRCGQLLTQATTLTAPTQMVSAANEFMLSLAGVVVVVLSSLLL